MNSAASSRFMDHVPQKSARSGRAVRRAWFTKRGQDTTAGEKSDGRETKTTSRLRNSRISRLLPFTRAVRQSKVGFRAHFDQSRGGAFEFVRLVAVGRVVELTRLGGCGRDQLH